MHSQFALRFAYFLRSSTCKLNSGHWILTNLPQLVSADANAETVAALPLGGLPNRLAESARPGKRAELVRVKWIGVELAAHNR